MIFIDITGDLGNQLFQYATAKSLSVDKKDDLLINLDYFNSGNDDKKHSYQLEHFNINNNHIDGAHIKELSNVHIISETKPIENNVETHNLNKNFEKIYLKGNWQNERYFKHNSYFIKKCLSITTPPSPENKKILDEITLSNSICLSFRKLEEFDEDTLLHEGLCSEEYYNNSIRLITKIVKNPTFFIFSNDIEWVEDNVKLDYPIMNIEFKKENKMYEDLRLMSNCEHFILANTTLNWWAAWLSNNENKTIIAPTPWYRSYTNQNILCPNWIHVNSTNKNLFNKLNTKIYELITEEDFKELKCRNIQKENGKYGLKLYAEEENAKIELKIKNPNNLLIELKLFSQNNGLIKINYGSEDIPLSYRKGYSVRYLQLLNKDSENLKLILKIFDSSLIIEHISIKSMPSKFHLSI